MIKNIVIIGTGGLAKETKLLIDAINQCQNQWNLVGFADNWGRQKGDVIIGGKAVIGTVDCLNNIDEEICAVVAIAEHVAWKKEAISMITNPKVKFPNLIHPTALMSPYVQIGKGNIIQAFSAVSCDVEIGDFNFFNSYCSIGHDTEIGSYNVVNPKTSISGSVTIGDNNYFGLHSSVIDGKSIGDNNKIGACSFVMRNIKNDCFYFGVPAKKMTI